MSSIRELCDTDVTAEDGVYIAEPIDTGTTREGVEYQRVWLSDTTGRLLAFAWADTYKGPPITSHAVIRARVRISTREFGTIGKLMEAAVLSLPIITSDDQRSGDVRVLRQRLDKLMASLTRAPLQTFVATALALPAVRDTFWTAKGSCSDHHSYGAGLVEHSVETAEFLAGAKAHGTDSRELAIVAALFHDFGKTRTIGKSGDSKLLTALVGHEFLTTEILSEPLRELDASWPDAAAILRHVWLPAKRHGSQRLMLASHIAELVRVADRASAQSNRAANAPSIVILPPKHISPVRG